MARRDLFRAYVSTAESIPHPLCGPRYRCALTLSDGTHLPCAELRSKTIQIELAKRRLSEEASGKRALMGPDPLGRILSTFVASGNRVSDHSVAAVSASPFAAPIALLDQIERESFMGWTGWVFEMRDGRLFAYGSDFRTDFIGLPEGYAFGDVVKVHNHAYLSQEGMLLRLERGGLPPKDYRLEEVRCERVPFICFIDGI